MPSTTFILLFLLISTHLILAAPSPQKEERVIETPTSIHLHSYSNPSTSSNCNLDCRRIFCNSVSQFLESVTCISHRPCLSLNLQFKIQEKCLNWRPEIHHGSGVAAIGGATPAADAKDPDCTDGALPPSAPQWVKAYVPAGIAYEWVKGEASSTRTMPVLEDEVNRKTRVMCVGVVRWICVVGVAVVLFGLWQVRERRQKRLSVDWRIKGKEEMRG